MVKTLRALRRGDAVLNQRTKFRAVRLLSFLTVPLILTACATREPRIVTKEVKVPVPVACAASPGPDPAFSDTPEALRAAADLFEQVKLLLAGRAQRDARLAELKAAVAGCG